MKDRDTVGDGVRDPLTEAELDALDVPLAEPEADEDADGVIVAVLTVCMGVPVSLWARAVCAKQVTAATNQKGDTARKVCPGRAWVRARNDIFIINVCDAPVCGAGRGGVVAQQRKLKLVCDSETSKYSYFRCSVTMCCVRDKDGNV